MSDGVFQTPDPVVLNPFADKTGYFFMPDSVLGEFEPSPDGNEHESYVDYTVPFDCALTGAQLILKGHTWGDFCYMKVMHPQAGEVGRFGQKIRVDDSRQAQDWLQVNYKADLVAGLILRIFYTTKKTVDPVKVAINFKIHKKVVT